MIESPCILVCAISERTGLCRGCGRTLEEIAGWGAITPERRRTIMAELPARRAGVAMRDRPMAESGEAR